jgi:hypothetical protein
MPCRSPGYSRLQVAMGDPFAMGGVQSIQDLARIFHGLFYRKRPSQPAALDEFHHQGIMTHIVQMADMRMVERSD